MGNALGHVCIRLLVFLPVGLAGCAAFEDRPLSPDQGLDRLLARTLGSNELEAYLRRTSPPETWPLPEWDLPRLTLAALFYHPELDVVRARWAAAKARTQVDSELPNPTLGLAPGYNTSTGGGASISPWIVGVALDLPLETAHKRGYRMAEALSLSESARLEIAQTAWTIRHQVRDAFLDLYALTQREQSLIRDLELAADQTGFQRHLLAAGEISVLEADEAATQEGLTRLAWLNAGQKTAMARARLAAAMGVPLEALDGVRMDFGVFERLPDPPTAEMRRNALLHRADLLAGLADYQASQAALQQQIARQYPDVQIGPGYEFDQGEDKWLLGLSMTLPVFHRNRGEIAAAEAAREEAAARVRVLQARIIAQVEQAVAQYGTGLEQLRTCDRIAEDLKTRRDRLQKMFETGEIVHTEVTVAEQQFNAALSARTEARVVALKALGQLENAMQTAPDLPSGLPTEPRTRTGQTETTHQGSGA